MIVILLFFYLDWLYCRRGKNKVGFFYWMNLFKKLNKIEKKFLMDALSEELGRLEVRSKNLEDFMD